MTNLLILSNCLTQKRILGKVYIGLWIKRVGNKTFLKEKKTFQKLIKKEFSHKIKS